MAAEDTEKSVEKREDAPERKVGDSVSAEITDAREEFNEREKEKAAGLKRSDHSGVSAEFGKLLLEDDSKLSLPAAPPDVADAPPQAKAGDSGLGAKQSAYKGEDISRDVPPESYYVGAGEKVEDIAKRHLGKDASKDDIAKHVKEIEQLNGLKKGDTLSEGMSLKLPGHTTDGGFITSDDKGVRHTVWPDGRDKVEDTVTGKWIYTKPSRYGLQEEHGGSKRPEENFVLVKENNGRYRLADHLDEKPWERERPMIGLMNVDDRPIGSKQLTELAEQKIKDPEQLAQFRADMLRFEERCKNRDLGTLEATAVYDEISKMLKHEGNTPTTEADRLKLAEQVMRQVATPSCIDQGDHKTCNVATVESRTYKRNPVAAAKLVADVATTGKYTDSDGTTVELGATNLKPDSQGSVNPPQDGARSYASQLFQITATNLALEKENSSGFITGAVRYEQYRPGDTDGAGNRVKSYPEDTGERLIDYSKSPPAEVRDSDGQPARAPNLRVDQIVGVSNAISGDSRYEHVLFNHEKNLIGDGKGVTVINSEPQFEQKLIDAQQSGNFPVLVTVDTTCEPFWTDSGGGTAGGSGGTHLVTITGYEAGPPSRVSVDGQWGSANDHAGKRSIPLHDLYMSMRNPKASPEVTAELRQEVETRRAANSVETLKEFELLRLETNEKVKGKEAPPQGYDNELSRLMTDAENKWKKDSSDTYEQERTRRAFMGMLKRLPPERQDAVIDQVRKNSPEDPELEKQIVQLQARRRTSYIVR